MLIVIVPSLIQAQMETLSIAYNNHAYQRFSEAVQLAADSAVDQVTPASISDGNVLFDQIQADATFKKVLANNLDLDPTTLQPLPGTVFSQAPTIVEEKFIDFSNTASFPYHYTDSQYGIDTEINGPSIVYVVDIPAKKAFTFSGDLTFQSVLVQAYPEQ